LESASLDVFDDLEKIKSLTFLKLVSMKKQGERKLLNLDRLLCTS
jgi:hypothetical protein